MSKAIAVNANETRGSLVEGPCLITKQPLYSPTVAIAVVGSYKLETVFDSSANKHDKFLTLLSTETDPAQLHRNGESDEQRERRQEFESHLPDIRQRRCCDRYKESLRDHRMRRRHRNAEHFCDARDCSHGPAPSTFPGDQHWTFASGTASFDAAAKEGRSPHRVSTSGGVSPAAPHVSDSARALDHLGHMLRAAVAAGLADVKVIVSPADGAALGPPETDFTKELQGLTSRVLETVAGWLARDEVVVVCPRPFGITRNLGVLGSRNTQPFMIYDEQS